MNEEGFDKDVYEELGIGFTLSWRFEEADKRWTPEYKAFIENDCQGILTEEEAIECYKRYSGRMPVFVKEWPEIDAITSERKRRSADLARMGIFGENAQRYFATYLPYEPAIRFAY